MIELILNEERYENDIRALLMAFYHGEKILARKPENMGASERKKSREQADGQERAEGQPGAGLSEDGSDVCRKSSQSDAEGR